MNTLKGITKNRVINFARKIEQNYDDHAMGDGMYYWCRYVGYDTLQTRFGDYQIKAVSVKFTERDGSDGSYSYIVVYKNNKKVKKYILPYCY